MIFENANKFLILSMSFADKIVFYWIRKNSEFFQTLTLKKLANAMLK